jgi:hypothetical protein
MRRALVLVAALVVTGGAALPAGAAPPTHERSIDKGVSINVPLVAECPSAPGASSIDITFNAQFHGVFNEQRDTFHTTSTNTGTFTVVDGAGGTIASGHFVTHTSEQGPGFPILAVSDSLKATGKTVEGDLINIHLQFHVTVNANDEVTVVVDTVSC